MRFCTRLNLSQPRSKQLIFVSNYRLCESAETRRPSTDEERPTDTVQEIRYESEYPRHAPCVIYSVPCRSHPDVASISRIWQGRSQKQQSGILDFTVYQDNTIKMGSGGFGTPSVALATTPTVLSTFFSHIFAKRKRHSSAKKSLEAGGPGGGPENQLSYEEGLKVVRRFIDFASHHGVEEVQAFTAMAVPNPR